MVLAGKKVFVTGGAVRVGAEIVRAFAREGAFLTIHYRESVSEASALLKEIGGKEKGHGLFQMDFSGGNFREDTDSFRRLGEIFSGTDILVNNASCFFRKGLAEETMEEMEKQFQVNFFAPVRLMKLFAASTEGPRCILNILDQGIAKTDSKAFSYALSKKALAEATKSAALSLAPRIRVNGIAPGPMLPPADMPFSKMEKSREAIPRKRIVSTKDVAESCLFAARNESMTGAILFVDGGLSLL
ncbi:MAG: SDR family oxidoreductase [Lentisphaeria bacterium]|nr:SDR family oxidoreductase [Lentisphaeria bacterium]